MPSVKGDPKRVRRKPSPTEVRVPAGINDMSVLDAALTYAALGWHVGPVRRGSKNPGSLLGPAWHTKTTTDPATIREFYRKNPSAGVFIHTGPSGIVVFDLDKTENLDDLSVDLATALRAGVFHQSRPNGDRGHYLFRTDERLGNSAGGFAAWGDVRASNGVIIAALTIHPTTKPAPTRKAPAKKAAPAKPKATTKAAV